MPDTQAKTNQQRIKEITESIETGIREMFETERYQSYLSTMGYWRCSAAFTAARQRARLIRPIAPIRYIPKP